MQNTSYQNLKDKIFSFTKLNLNEKPLETVIDKAIEIVSLIEELKLPIPNVSTIYNGIFFEWYDMEIEILNNGDIEVLFMFNKDKNIEEFLKLNSMIFNRTQQ